MKLCNKYLCMGERVKGRLCQAHYDAYKARNKELGDAFFKRMERARAAKAERRSHR